MKTLLTTAFLLLAATPAFAHAHLASATPADGATVAAPTELVLTFTEGLVLKFSGVAITGPDGAVVPIEGTSLDPKDDKVLDVTLNAPLPAGAYSVAWHVLSSDGHKTAGSYSFVVK